MYLGVIKHIYSSGIVESDEGHKACLGHEAKIGDILIFDGKDKAVISKKEYQTVYEAIPKKTRAKPKTKAEVKEDEDSKDKLF